MFNLNKNNEVKFSDIKNNATDLADSVQENIAEISEEISSDVKQSVSKMSNKVQEKAKETIKESQDDAMTLINNLRALLSENVNTNTMRDVKEQVFDKASEWKNLVQDEVTRTIEASNAQTKKVVREQPLLSLGIAVGAGILLGYVLGNKQSSDK